MSQGGTPLQFDPDEDLFDFASVASSSGTVESDEDLDEVFAAFRDVEPEEELLPAAPASLTAPVPQASAPSPAPARPAPPAEPSLPSRAAPPLASPSAGSQASEPAREVLPVRRAVGLSKGLVAVALSVTVLNAVLAVVFLRGRTSASEPTPVVVRPEPEVHPGSALAAPPHGSSVRLPDPEAVDPAHAHPALDEARAEIGRGEYAGARQRVYGLLAIIDRLEDPRRSTLEADCQFLIAQSLHMEALARMGGSK